MWVIGFGIHNTLVPGYLKMKFYKARYITFGSEAQGIQSLELVRGGRGLNSEEKGLTI